MLSKQWIILRIEANKDILISSFTAAIQKRMWNFNTKTFYDQQKVISLSLHFLPKMETGQNYVLTLVTTMICTHHQPIHDGQTQNE